MLSDKVNVYAIAGFGFKPSIFLETRSPMINYIGLDYVDKCHCSLDDIAMHLASKLPSQSILAGWSFGGLIAIKIAALYPDKVNKLILLASSPRFLAALNWVGISENDANHFYESFMENTQKQMSYFYQIVCYPDSRRALDALLWPHFIKDLKQDLSYLLKTMLYSDLREEYRYLNVDILHLISQNDAVIPVDALLLNQLSPRAGVRVFNKLGHAGFIVKRHEYTRAMMEFLNHANH